MALPQVGDGEQIGDGNINETLKVGKSTQAVQIAQSGGSVGFYGTTPATQRAAAIQAASVVSASSYITVASNLAAWAAEVAATLTGLGAWKGSA